MAKPKLDVQLLEDLWRVATAASRHVESTMKEAAECSLAQLLVLRALGAQPPKGKPLGATAIGRLLGCTKANAGQLVTRLEQSGRIEKAAGGEDGRVVALRLTARGERAAAKGEARLAEDAKSVFGALDAREKKQLLALLAKVTSPSAEESLS